MPFDPAFAHLGAAEPGGLLCGITCSNNFLNLSPRIMKIKTKINKRDPLKLKSFFTGKETTNQMNLKNPMDGGAW